MATLISPGVDATIIDESFYIPGRATCLPLFFIATADEKFQVDGVSPAVGTYENNILRTVTSLKQSLELYGVPKFFTSVNGDPHHGDARNEYGLDALNKYLEIGNRAYVIRANVNLNDNLADIKDMWLNKIQIAADYLNELVSEWIAQYNTVNNYFPSDLEYKTSVDKDTLKTLLNQALNEVFAAYSFNKDQFQIEFLQDHTQPQAGYQDVLTETYAGYITLSDIVGFEDGKLYGAQVRIVHTTGTDIVDLYFNGEDIVTFGDLIDAINNELGAFGTCELIQGRIRITSSLLGATSAVRIITDGPTGYLPLFSSLNLFDRILDPINGRGIETLSVYDDTYTTIVGSYDGLHGQIDSWNLGSEVSTEFTAAEAEGLLLAAAEDFDNTKEFVKYTSLGNNDATRRAEIVKQLQAAINNPFNGSRDEYLEYNVALAPGYFELSDELLRLTQDMLEEVFIIGETPMDKPPTGPNSIANWAVTPAKSSSYHIGYWYGHGISSNLDGADILSTASATAIRTIAYNDAVAAEWYAPGGVNRGTCPHLSNVGYVSGTLGGPTTFVEEWLNTGTRDELYEFPKNINPISFIPGRGILVLGQKTTSPAISALDRINVSRLVKYIKRQLRKGLFSFLFEPNDKITRDLVKAACDGFLSTLVDRRALYDFATIVDESNNTAETIDRNELYVDIAIKPVKAIEFIYVRVRVVRTGANIGTGRNV